MNIAITTKAPNVPDSQCRRGRGKVSGNPPRKPNQLGHRLEHGREIFLYAKNSPGMNILITTKAPNVPDPQCRRGRGKVSGNPPRHPETVGT